MRAMYASAWRSFEAWTEARGNLPMPASPPLAAAYLAHLAEECRLSVATIRLHRAALAAIRKTNGHEDPTDHQGVRWVMKGIALAAVRATARARRPGTPGIGCQGFLARQRGPGAAIPSQRRAAPELRGRGAHLGRRGAAG